MTDADLEVYRQRYETFRHLDKLRWQMLQIVVAVLSAAALVYRSSPDGLEGPFRALIGLALVTVAVVSWRISAGLAANGTVLREVGARVSDTAIPDQSRWHASWTNWLTLFVGVGGLASLMIGLKETFEC